MREPLRRHLPAIVPGLHQPLAVQLIDRNMRFMGVQRPSFAIVSCGDDLHAFGCAYVVAISKTRSNPHHKSQQLVTKADVAGDAWLFCGDH